MKERAATWGFVRSCDKMGATSQLCPMLLLLCLALLVCCSLAFPLCSNLDAPRAQKGSLKFCSAPQYRSNGCCDASQDARLSEEFQSLNGTSPQCGAFIQQILCARCDQFAADLFGAGEQPGRSVPYLCNAGSSPYCAAVWDACGNQPLPTSFLSSAGIIEQAAGISATSTALSSLFQNATDFCTSFGPPQDSPLGDVCFSGKPYELPLPSAANQAAPGPPAAICLDKLDTGAYLNLIPHPDRSDHAFLAAQSGQIWLATIPANQPRGAQAQQATIGVNRSSPPFLDLSDRVVNEGESGLLGLAFHPNFLANGRFFVSYICDKLQWADCGGKCACYSDVGCNPSDLGSLAGPFPCRFSSVIAEYSANGTAPASAAGRAEAREVRRIFTLGLPYPNHHGGQILFGPLDGYLYYMIGDGGNSGDPFNFAQNRNSLLGKIHRLDVDALPSEQEIQQQGLWGNYSIPPTNPLVNDSNARPEIWALGLRNPWRCSFDSRNPLYFYCGDVGQDMYEEVDLISRGGNYGWRVFEGNALFNASWAPGGSTKPGPQLGAIPPILVYSHSSNVSTPRAASITGGYVSRSTLDACIYGRYVYADLYGLVWVATETPAGGGNYSTSAISYQCAASSPLPCDVVEAAPGAGASSSPSLQPIYSFAEDARRDMFLLTDAGVYRVTNPDKCSLVCDAALPPYASPDLAPFPGSQPNSASCPPAPSAAALIILMVNLLLV